MNRTIIRKLTEKCLHLRIWNERVGLGDSAAHFCLLGITEAHGRLVLLDKSEKDFAHFILPIFRQAFCLGYSAFEKLGHSGSISQVHLPLEDDAFIGLRAASDGIDRIYHAALPAHDVVGEGDDAPVGRGDMRERA